MINSKMSCNEFRRLLAETVLADHYGTRISVFEGYTGHEIDMNVIIKHMLAM